MDKTDKCKCGMFYIDSNETGQYSLPINCVTCNKRILDFMIVVKPEPIIPITNNFNIDNYIFVNERVDKLEAAVLAFQDGLDNVENIHDQSHRGYNSVHKVQNDRLDALEHKINIDAVNTFTCHDRRLESLNTRIADLITKVEELTKSVYNNVHRTQVANQRFFDRKKIH